ncbi:hypothetical protein [Actinoplanes sp. NBRC 101535]|uniref:hypothetical protein n=1 Tax=Actinoplanes sp. NBRC 101535 TaxID=3032196 RepID=UPI0024A4747F|nr:hypothetical protein [Actinoplanes sp. NBRC 101535]GLY00507.1 hypothetical protein Acsp01_08860 [Actinoplanes sp. NBRC 101535]
MGYTDWWLGRQHAENETHRIAAQTAYDDHWRRLIGNDQELVLGVLSAAFEAVPGRAPVGAVAVDACRRRCRRRSSPRTQAEPQAAAGAGLVRG